MPYGMVQAWVGQKLLKSMKIKSLKSIPDVQMRVLNPTIEEPRLWENKSLVHMLVFQFNLSNKLLTHLN
jgi:hypothetical protein